MSNGWAWIAFAVLIAGCGSELDESATNGDNEILFEQLALVEIGLDFPRTLTQLETCYQVNDVKCLQSYELFTEEKTELFSLPRHAALELILHQMLDSCIANPRMEVEYRCIGALVALYFFSEEAEDERVVQFLSDLPQAVRGSILNRTVSMNVSWLDSRSDIDEWRSWVDLQPLDKELNRSIKNRLQQTDPASKAIYTVIGGHP